LLPAISPWSKVEGRKYDDLTENDDLSEKKGGECAGDLMRLIAGRALDPDFLDRRAGDLGGKQEKEFVES